MFGEIDCREGLTMAVDKLKYETVDAAMDVLLHIYKGDATLLAKRFFRVLPCVVEKVIFVLEVQAHATARDWYGAL